MGASWEKLYWNWCDISGKRLSCTRKKTCQFAVILRMAPFFPPLKTTFLYLASENIILRCFFFVPAYWKMRRKSSFCKLEEKIIILRFHCKLFLSLRLVVRNMLINQFSLKQHYCVSLGIRLLYKHTLYGWQ